MREIACDFKVMPLFCSSCGGCSGLTCAVVWQSDLCFQAKAIEALQRAAEDYLVHLFEDVSQQLWISAVAVADFSGR